MWAASTARRSPPITNFSPCSLTNYNGYGPGGPYGTNVSIQNPNRIDSVGQSGPRQLELARHRTRPSVLHLVAELPRRPVQSRHGSCYLPGPDGIDQYCVPAFTVPDNVTNNEVGWKTEWFDQRVQFNGAVYQEIWSNAQTGFFDPQGGLGNLAFATNGPSYRIRGVEPSVIGRVTSGLTVRAAAAWNSSSQTNSPYLVNNNPKSPTYGQNITSIQNPYGPLGSPTSYSPPFNANLRIRYEWPFNDYNGFVQVGGQHQTHMVTATGYVPAFDLPGFTTYDASAGVAKDAWTVQIYGQNITNVNSSLSTNQSQFILAETPQRPRVLGIKFSYKFGGK